MLLLKIWSSLIFCNIEILSVLIFTFGFLSVSARYWLISNFIFVCSLLHWKEEQTMKIVFIYLILNKIVSNLLLTSHFSSWGTSKELRREILFFFFFISFTFNNRACLRKLSKEASSLFWLCLCWKAKCGDIW